MHPDRATGDRSDMFFHNPDAPHETAMPSQLRWCVKGAVNGAGFAVDQRFRPFLPGASLRFRRATATCGLPENQKWSEVVSFDHLRMDYAWTLRFRGVLAGRPHTTGLGLASRAARLEGPGVYENLQDVS